jgi:hypothetical protein
MTRQIARGLAALSLVLATALPATAARLTSERLTELCRPQLEAQMRLALSELPLAIPALQRNGAENPDLRESSAEEIRIIEIVIADYRENGIGAAHIREMIDVVLQPGVSNADLRQALADSRTYSDPDSAVAVCLLEAVLADPEWVQQNQGVSIAAGRLSAPNDEALVDDVTLDEEDLRQLEEAEAAGYRVSPADETPLGLRSANPAQTGALAPDNEERYWLRARAINSSQQECGEDCPPLAVRMTILRNDVVGSHQTGTVFEGDLHFGPPMTAGTVWEIRMPIDSDFYDCNPRLVTGSVGVDERAINIGFATYVPEVYCALNEAGRGEFVRIRNDREGRTLDLIGVPVD